MVPKKAKKAMIPNYQNRRNKRALAYVRISSERQINGESPETQLSAIQGYAAREGMEIVDTFYDEAKSGKNTERIELQNMLKYAEEHKGEIDHVIVYKMNRASRDLESYIVGFSMRIKALGVSIRSATEPIDDTPIGRTMEYISVIMGQMENETRRAFTVDNMTSLSYQGYWLHPPVVGYQVTKIPNEAGKLRPTLKKDKSAPLVKQVLERFSEGDITKAELTRYAHGIGLRSRYGKRMSEDAIHKLLKKSVYAGYVQNNFTQGELIEGKHEAIISRETYEKNQRLLYGHRKRLGEVRQKLHPDYPLKGLVMCPNCKKPLYASAPKTGSGGKSPRYHCSRPSCKGSVASIKAVSMHDSFEELLERIQPEKEMLDLFKEVVLNRMAQELGSLNAKKGEVHARLQTIAGNRLNAIKKFTADQLTESEKNDLVASLDNEKEVYTDELHKLEAQQFLRESDIDLAVAVMKDTKKQWEVASPQARERFQSALFPKGLVYDAETQRFGTTEMSPLYRVTSNKKDLPVSEKSFLVAGVGFEPTTLWL